MYIYITTNLVVKDVINKYMSRTSYILGKKKSYKNYCLSTVTFLMYPSSSYFSWFCLFWFFLPIFAVHPVHSLCNPTFEKAIMMRTIFSKICQRHQSVKNVIQTCCATNISPRFRF